MQIHGGNRLDIAEKHHLNPTAIIDFSSNINPWGPSETVVKAVSSVLKDMGRYPDPETRYLRPALSKYLGVPEESILVGNGSSELIYLVVASLRPSCALVIGPTFSEYERALKAQDGQVAQFYLQEGEEFAFYPERIRKLPDRAFVFVCNPNNPTGTLSTLDKMLWLRKEVEAHAGYLIVDEAFMDFVREKEKFTLVKEAAEKDGIIVIGSLGKFFSLAGLRLGYLVASQDMVSRIAKMRCPWNINSIALAAGAAALADAKFISETSRQIEEERDLLSAALEAIPYLKTYPGSANFVLVKLTEKSIRVDHLAEYLASRGILIRECTSFSGLDNSYFRLAVLDRDSNCLLIDHLRGFFMKKEEEGNEQN